MRLFSTTRYITDQPHDSHHQTLSPLLEKQLEVGTATPLVLLQPLRRWLLGIEISDRKLARTLCSLIPARCPFERTFKLFGRTVSIPPLCKLNPFYNELVTLRFRSLCYLAEVVGEDISRFC